MAYRLLAYTMELREFNLCVWEQMESQRQQWNY